MCTEQYTKNLKGKRNTIDADTIIFNKSFLIQKNLYLNYSHK